MADIRLVKIGDIATTNASSYSTKDNWGYVNYLDTGNITQNVIDSIQYIDLAQEKLPSRAKRKVKKNSIIYSTVRPNQLHYGIIKNQPQNFLVSTGFTVIDVDESKAVAEYVYYFLTQNEIVESLQAIGEQSVSTYPSIKPSDIEDIEIPLLSLDIQKKIVGILKSLDAKIESNSAINNNLEQQATALFKSWFVDFEPWDGQMPTAWISAPLGSFVDIKRGGSPRPIQDYLSDEGLRWLKISDVTSLTVPYVLDIKEHIREEGLKKTVFLKAGELVLSNSATPGIPKILGVDSCIHDGWLYFPKSELSKYFLYLLFKHIRKELIALGNGSVFTNLKTDILKAYPISKADKDTLNSFDQLVIPLFNAMLNLCKENRALVELRNLLIQKMMSGEIDVSEVEI